MLSYQSSLRKSPLAILLHALVMCSELPVDVPLYRLQTRLIEVLAERKHCSEDILVLGAGEHLI